MSDAEQAPVKPGHGDHWLAALPQDDPRILTALEPPVDAPDRLALHRTPLTGALDRVQVTHQRRLVTAYPEPRATTLLEAQPRELLLWETRVEGWLVVEHPLVGALTVFLTDLAENANRYAATAAATMRLEVGALAYFVSPLRGQADAPDRLAPAAATDPRFLADDYHFRGTIAKLDETKDEIVLDITLQNGLVLPVTARGGFALDVGDRVEGYLWLTARWTA